MGGLNFIAGGRAEQNRRVPTSGARLKDRNLAFVELRPLELIHACWGQFDVAQNVHPHDFQASVQQARYYLTGSRKYIWGVFKTADLCFHGGFKGNRKETTLPGWVGPQF